MMRRALALVHAWLVLDFFGDARRTGGGGSTLTTTIFTQSFLGFVFAALLYPDTPPVPFAAANLCLAALLVSVSQLDHQESTARRRADQTLLAAAPIGGGTVLLARAGHASFYVCLVTIAMALPPAVLLAFLRGDWRLAIGYAALACLTTGLACGALAVLLRALARCLGAPRAALIAGSLKAMLLGGGIVLFALGLRRLDGTAADLPIGRLGAEVLPPYQAARVLADPVGESWRLGLLLGGALLLVALALVLGDRERARTPRLGRSGPLRWLLHRLAPRGPGLGIAEFTAVSMWRSAGFRARVLPLIGLPAGMAVLSLPGTEPRHGFVFVCLLLQLPAIYLPILIAFLPRADQAEAAWLFDQAPDLTLERVQDATWRALVSHVLLPVYGIAMVLLATARRDPDVVAAAVFAAALAVVATRPMVRSLRRVPFTREGDADLTIDLGGLFAAAIVLGGIGMLYGGLLPASQRWPAAALAVAAATWLLRRPVQPGGTPLRVPGGSERAAAPTTESTAAAAPVTPAAQLAASSLRRELRAIAVLYAASCVLPALVGTMFAV
ncbi:MAG: hypothetical protein JNL08_08530 [Planctomycetes bacterium]|nr:hypothetical protein [Planctomycetota bacterium]